MRPPLWNVSLGIEGSCALQALSVAVGCLALVFWGRAVVGREPMEMITCQVVDIAVWQVDRSLESFYVVVMGIIGVQNT